MNDSKFMYLMLKEIICKKLNHFHWSIDTRL